MINFEVVAREKWSKLTNSLDVVEVTHVNNFSSSACDANRGEVNKITDNIVNSLNVYMQSWMLHETFARTVVETGFGAAERLSIVVEVI